MIGRLRGSVVSLDSANGQLLIDVAGVGYQVAVPAKTLAALPGPGAEAVLHTHLLVRQDDQALYGFLTEAERDLFRALLRINSVGPKLALAVIGAFALADLAALVASNDVAALTQVPGIGKKTGERMLFDLKGLLTRMDIPVTSAGAVAAPSTRQPGSAASEAEQALIRLGYRPQAAARMVRDVQAPDATLEDMVREALRRAGA